MKKNFITGIVVGGMLFGGAGAWAGYYTAVENPFPIQLNGANISLEGYNINDNTYFKLRDIADAVGGFTVGFENDTIVLTSDKQNSVTATPAPSQTADISNNDSNVSYSEAVEMLKAEAERVYKEVELQYNKKIDSNAEKRQEYENEIADLEEELSELEYLASIYENAATDEGQNKYKRVLSDIEDTEENIAYYQGLIEELDASDESATATFESYKKQLEANYYTGLSGLQALYSE